MKPDKHKGRGAVSNATGRFETNTRETFDDGWEVPEQSQVSLRTTLSIDTARRLINYNQSPDVGFDRSINPYRGCEHGCIYCFARPTHTWLGLSAGLDFETRLFYKPDAVALLGRELAKPGYRAAPIALGINTDAYQPVERRLQLTRSILHMLNECRHPVTIVTKSPLIERDTDILVELARDGLVQVMVSITTLNKDTARTLEPRAATPQRRLHTIENLSAAGVAVGVLIAPVIPVLTDHELERIMQLSRQAGACSAGYVLIRLPHEVGGLFQQWLNVHAPQAADHVMNRIRDCREGREYVAEFGTRMRGTGPYAELLSQRFQLAAKRLGFAQGECLRTDLFQPPFTENSQLSLF
jgi:DNA repair photolyase